MIGKGGVEISCCLLNLPPITRGPAPAGFMIRRIVSSVSPWKDAALVMSTSELHSAIRNYANTTALVGGLLSGTGVAAIISDYPKVTHGHEVRQKHRLPVSKMHVEQLYSGLLSAGTFGAFFTTISSTLVLVSLDTIPLSQTKAFVARHSHLIACPAWFVGPCATCMGLAIACSVEANYGGR